MILITDAELLILLDMIALALNYLIMYVCPIQLPMMRRGKFVSANYHPPREEISNEFFLLCPGEMVFRSVLFLNSLPFFHPSPPLLSLDITLIIIIVFNIWLLYIQDRDFDRKVVSTSFVYVSTVAAIAVTSAMDNNNNASTTATPTASTTPQSNSINSYFNSSSDSISSNSSGSGSERDHPNSNSNSISNHNNNNLDNILGTDQNVDPFSILWDNS